MAIKIAATNITLKQGSQELYAKSVLVCQPKNLVISRYMCRIKILTVTLQLLQIQLLKLTEHTEQLIDDIVMKDTYTCMYM